MFIQYLMEYIHRYILKTMKTESLLCFCASRFTAVAALQAWQSVFINLLRHRRLYLYLLKTESLDNAILAF